MSRAGVGDGLSPEAVAGQARWSLERLRALPGRCRGSLLRDWGVHTNRLFGAGASDLIRSDVGLDAVSLPDTPDRRAWYPLWFQLAVTRAIADRYADGRLLALEPVLFEAGTGTRDKVVQWTMRRAGPRLVLRYSDRIHAALYDVGRARATTRRGQGVVTWEGAEHVLEPTWQTLQMIGLRSLVKALGKQLEGLTLVASGPRSVEARLAWR